MHNLKCQICEVDAVWRGYCGEHRNILRKQLVLDALDALGKPSTSIEIRDGIRNMFGVFLAYQQVSSAIHSLHHGGFLVKHPSPGIQHGARWSMV